MITSVLWAAKTDTANALRGTVTVLGTSSLLATTTNHVPALIAASIGAGAAGMGVSTLCAVRVRELTPHDSPQRMWSALTITFAAAFAAASAAFARMAAATGTYHAAFGCSAAAGFVAALLPLEPGTTWQACEGVDHHCAPVTQPR